MSGRAREGHAPPTPPRARALARLLGCLVLLLATGSPARADAPTALQELLERVDRFHPRLVAARLDMEIARAHVTEKRGAFDPALHLYSDYTRYNGGEGNVKEASDSSAIVSLLTPEGVLVSGGIDYDRGAVKSPLSPTGALGEYFVDVRVPLLRGSGINPRSIAVKQALVKVSGTEVYYRLARLQVLLSASSAWWEWSAATRRAEIMEALLEMAVARADLVKGRVKEGDVAAMDSFEAEQEVARRREALSRAERERQKSLFKLQLYSWDAEFAPGGLPVESAANQWPALTSVSPTRLGELTLLALARRPELQSLQFDREVITLDLDLALNDRKPRVDLFASPGFDAGHGGAGFTLRTGISVTIPLRTREADGRVEAARLRLSRLDVQQAHEVRSIVVDVQDAVNAVNNAVERQGMAEEALRLAQRLEKGERLRYDLGEGTLFMVNQRERATADARLRVVDIEAEHAQALYLLRAVTGQL